MLILDMKSLALLHVISFMILPSLANQPTETTRPFDYQELHCWDHQEFHGHNVVIQNNLEDFDTIGFNDKAVSCCFHGLWVLYANRFFNKEGALQPDAPRYVGWGLDECVLLNNSMQYQTSSARYVGSRDGYRFDTLTLFEGQNYAGIDQYILDDNPSVLLGANSAIVTGISGWTLYEAPNFLGASVCIFPLGDVAFTPGLIPDFQLQVAMSVRKGCWA